MQPRRRKRELMSDEAASPQKRLVNMVTLLIYYQGTMLTGAYDGILGAATRDGGEAGHQQGLLRTACGDCSLLLQGLLRYCSC